jgi:signal transduction histidine kinase
LPKVFDLFMQIDRTLEKSRGGLGLGLPLVKRLVEMHGGKVTAHSEGLGRGSEFIVRLPVLIDGQQLDVQSPTVANAR